MPSYRTVGPGWRFSGRGWAGARLWSGRGWKMAWSSKAREPSWAGKAEGGSLPAATEAANSSPSRSNRVAKPWSGPLCILSAVASAQHLSPSISILQLRYDGKPCWISVTPRLRTAGFFSGMVTPMEIGRGMASARSLLASDGLGPRCKLFSFVRVLHRPQQRPVVLQRGGHAGVLGSQAVQGEGHVRVFRPESLLLDGERLRVEMLCRLVLLLTMIEDAEVVQAVSHGRMPRS